MDISLQRLDLTQIFCDVDDFYQTYEAFNARHTPRLSGEGQAKRYQSRLSLSEVMTIVIAFHASGYKTFKTFYTQKVLSDWRGAFPELVSYNRFVELMPWSVMALMAFLNHSCLGDISGVSFIKPAPQMSQDLFGKLFGDRGYVSQALFEQLFAQGLQLIARRRKNMKNTLMALLDKVLLRKRALIETVNDQLKNICQIEHSRHRSWFNFWVNLVSGLMAYSYHPHKPSIDIPNFDPKALPQAIF